MLLFKIWVFSYFSYFVCNLIYLIVGGASMGGGGAHRDFA